MKKFYIMAFLLFSSSNAYAGEVSLGAGLGIPYGVLGANINYQINEIFDLTAGAGAGFGAGFRVHPMSSKFRITAFYGTNAFLKTTRWGKEKIENFSGINIGIGYGAVSDGWDFDLIYAMLSDELKDRVTELQAQGYQLSGDIDNKVAISFGYHW